MRRKYLIDRGTGRRDLGTRCRYDDTGPDWKPDAAQDVRGKSLDWFRQD